MSQLSVPIKKEQAITCLLIGILSTLIPSVLFFTLDGIVVAIILYFTVILFLKNSKSEAILFTFSYGLLLVNSTFFLLLLNYVNGKPFLAGGDDLLFFTAGKELYINDFDINIEVDGLPLWVTNYPAYLFIISFYYKFLSFFGINSLSFYHFTLFKILLGSLIPILIYKIGHFVSIRFDKLALFVVLLMPTLVYHTTSFLRETVISFFFLSGVYIILSDKAIIIKSLLFILITVILYFIRPIHSFFFILFFLLYLIISRKTSSWIRLNTAFIILIVIYYFKREDSELFLQYQRTQSSYQELSAITSQEGSLGVKLYGANDLFFWPIKYFYYLFSPIPPPIVATFNLLTVYMSLGALLWYLLVIGIIKSGLRVINRMDPYFLTLYILFFLAGVVGVNTTKDPRHLVFIYPLIIPISLGELIITKKSLLLVLVFSFFIVGILGYILFKFIV